MPLTVEETRRIAAEVLAADHPALRVVGVKTEGGVGNLKSEVGSLND